MESLSRSKSCEIGLPGLGVSNRAPRSEAEPREAIGPRSRRRRSATPSAQQLTERVAVGLVRGVHGLRGAVRVEVLTDKPEDRFKPGQVLHREGSDEPLTIRSGVPVADGPGWRLQFNEIPDRTTAETLRGVYLETEIARDQALARGEYFWHEVIGSHVRDLDDRKLGVVRDVYRTGGAEVFVVSGGPAGEFDLPAVRAFIRVFAPRRGEIVVDAAALDLPIPEARRP